jgi:hypothetical protein
MFGLARTLALPRSQASPTSHYRRRNFATASVRVRTWSFS